jgi:glucosamine 6-phosphate synthetase-like amidotransferase/phosphosugar isomerase protein
VGCVTLVAVNRLEVARISIDMCGLFGLLRSPMAEHREWASDALIVLGSLAEERGSDSAGVAMFTGRAVPVAGPAPLDRADVSLDGCRVVKGRGRFSGVWRSDLLPLLDHAPVVLGHTRRATQGSTLPLVNAGPLVIDGIVATHNGDVEAAALRSRFALAGSVGGTDSEPIFQALAGRRSSTEITEVLEALVGRAALVWVERARPDHVHLARAALSPLTVAVDTEQNLYWASNPRWFREVAEHTRVRFVSAVMLREGSYLRLRRTPRPHVEIRADFLPTARPADLDERVWAGFTAADMATDRAGLRHLVQPSIGNGTGGFPIPV